jgi:septal ring factor EnvC (AmiA/AmiB activator)
MNTKKPGRQGLSDDQIRRAINELHADEQKVTPTNVRELLGTGSFTTISRVIADWQREMVSASGVAVPDPPKCVANLLRQLWNQAWESAHSTFDDERRRFAEGQTGAAKQRQEMLSEISRLEAGAAELSGRCQESERRLSRLHGDLVDRGREVANLKGQLESLRGELSMANQERQHATNQLTAWIERASRAEARIPEHEHSADPDASPQQSRVRNSSNVAIRG